MNNDEEEIKNLFDSVELFSESPASVDVIFSKLNDIMREMRPLSKDDSTRRKTELNFEFEKTLLQLKEAYAN